ncbi:hypothetical protein FB451DRAFT_240805 [Mycena latifolia]|nr:hypothetical protein FB451DRAFT_240805 [Mycena latifolia]
MASSASPAQISSAGQYSIYIVVGLVAQTFFFGVYTVIIVLSTRMLIKRGLKTRVNRTMFVITVFMYLLSTAYWVYSVADVADRMNVYIDDLLNPVKDSADHDKVTKWSPLFNALVLLNYIISDGIVVWRAWILCMRNRGKYLGATISFLVLTAVSVLCTIIFRVIGVIRSTTDSHLEPGIIILQVSNFGMSLLSNLTTTAVVGVILLRHCKGVRAAFTDSKRSSKADQVLTLLVESGVLYCISGLMVLVSSLIRLPQGTLGDLYAPIAVQIAGAYPSIVLLLVSMQRTLNETMFLNTFEDPAPSRPFEFSLRLPTQTQEARPGD